MNQQEFLDSSVPGKGVCMLTVSGIAFSLTKPDANDVRIKDIAWALSRINRFNGHTGSTTPLNVAQHSVTVMRLMRERYAGQIGRPFLLCGLLHDAHEAYLGDITSPVKKALGISALPHLVSQVQGAIHKAVGLEWPLLKGVNAIIRAADIKALLYEREMYGIGRAPQQEPLGAVDAADEFMGEYGWLVR